MACSRKIIIIIIINTFLLVFRSAEFKQLKTFNFTAKRFCLRITLYAEILFFHNVLDFHGVP